MRKVVQVTEAYKPVVSALRKLGYRAILQKKINANGTDIVAVSGDRVLRVEVKRATQASKRWHSLRVKPVSSPRRNDDLIAIIMPSGYVLIEPMADHLRCCNKYGSRCFTF